MLLLLRMPEPEYRMSKLYVEVKSADSAGRICFLRNLNNKARQGHYFVFLNGADFVELQKTQKVFKIKKEKNPLKFQR